MDAEAPPRQENVVETNGAVEPGRTPRSSRRAIRAFPAAPRRRRLRSPYGFHPSANQDDESEGPVPPSDAPVSE